MRITQALFASLLITTIPLAAFAQGEGEEAPVDEFAEEAPAEEAPAEEAPAEAAPAASELETEADVFEIRRGFWTQADLGVFFTLGGNNYDTINGKRSKGISNVQPFLGITAGYDIAYSDSYQLAIGGKLAAGYSSGAGRVTDDDIAQLGDDAATLAADFAIYEIAALVKLGLFVSDRVAINLSVDGGAGFIDPVVHLAATEPGAASSEFAPIFGGALGVEYYTLLNDFSIGFDARFQATMASRFIPGLSLTIPVRYTF